jgi:AcrR family transcriptional regulator
MTDGLGLRDRKKLETWRSISDAAATLFLQRGYEAVSVENIAKAANVSPSTFFNYFNTKESVVFDPAPADLVTVRGLLAGRPPGEELWTSLGEVLLAHLASIGSRLVTQKKVRASSPALADCGREVGDRVYATLTQWAAERHPDVAAMRALLLVNLSRAAVLTAYTAWDPDTGVTEFLAMTHECLDQVAAGVAPVDPGAPASAAVRPPI